MTKVLFIVNPISGTASKERIISLIPQYMSPERFSCEIRKTERSGHAAELASQAAVEGYDVVVAVGGDGTVNEVARSLVHTQTALGIIPCGSGNGLARHLYIPMNPEGALQVLADCQIHSLDYGRINGTPFFCTCGVGFDAFVSDKFAKSGRRGLLTYIENTLREGVNYKSQTYDIEIDGQPLTFKAFLIACANASQYGNNVYIAPAASMKDGLMDVTIMEPFSIIEGPQIALQLLNKQIESNSRIHSYRCRKLVIHRSEPGVIHFDGDPKEETADIVVELIPNDIKMVVNVNKQPYLPPLLRTFTNLYADMNQELNNLMRDIAENQRRFSAINKELLKKLRS